MKRRWIPFAAVAAAVVAADQLTKWWVVHSIEPYGKVRVIDGLVQLTHLYNPGGAFGFLSGGGLGYRHLLFVAAAVVAMALIVWLLFQVPDRLRWMPPALGLVFGGAVGNLVDRLRLGSVIDFIDVFVGPYHWPAFNVADSAITVGVMVVMAHLVFRRLD